ncbi:hypothetical protein [Mesorhizobium sp. M0701]|uniref:hypothetical protein n=1 Tax=Mesorhizobium sp. M0701 TaxID=2956989 RepID=UPI00333CA8DC
MQLAKIRREGRFWCSVGRIARTPAAAEPSFDLVRPVSMSFLLQLDMQLRYHDRVPKHPRQRAAGKGPFMKTWMVDFGVVPKELAFAQMPSPLPREGAAGPSK